jgi:flagellin
MSSLLTNTSAMVALQTLRTINMNLDQANNRVSTGLRVNNAADNAAYWSIATTLRSDNNALSAVQDSLGVGASAATATYTGLNSAKDLLDQLKSKLTTATGDVDRAKVQLEIDGILAQLTSVADQAVLQGDNWLNTTDTSTRQIVSSLYRDSSNQLAVGTIDVDVSDIRLFGAGAGILDKTIDLTTYGATGANAAVVDGTGVTFAATDIVSFSISKNGAPGTTVTIDADTLTAAGLDDTIYSNADLAAVYKQALSDAGVTGVDVSVDTAGAVSFSSLDDITVSYASNADTGGIDVADLGLNSVDDGDFTTSAASSGSIAVADIDISTASSATVQQYLKAVDEALSQVTDAATRIGAVQTRISSQQTFVKALIDAKTSAVGTLVDANMEEESTKLKALQTQQQLAVQSLSIANSNAQNILLLFRS